MALIYIRALSIIWTHNNNTFAIHRVTLPPVFTHRTVTSYPRGAVLGGDSPCGGRKGKLLSIQVTVLDVGRKVYSKDEQRPASKPRIERAFSIIDWDGIARDELMVGLNSLEMFKERVPDQQSHDPLQLL